MHYQHTLKFASKSYFHNFRVNHTQDQSLSDNTHDFNDKIHVKPIDNVAICEPYRLLDQMILTSCFIPPHHLLS